MWLCGRAHMIHTHPQMGPITEIIEGGAPGSPTRAEEWAPRREIRCTPSRRSGRSTAASAGYIRNSEMAKMRPDLVLECPGGKGTANMVEVAKASGLKVIRLEKMPVIRSEEPHQTGRGSRLRLGRQPAP
jgi:hypothetical protein